MREYRIDYSKLNTFLESFNKENDNLLYLQKSFDLSYIGNRNEDCIKKIKTGIDSKFKSIDDSYKKISSWWNEYLKTVNYIEEKKQKICNDILIPTIHCEGGLSTKKAVVSNSSSTPSYAKSDPLYLYSVDFDVMGYFNSDDYVDPEVQAIVDKYGMEVGNLYQLNKELENYRQMLLDENEELKKEQEEIMKELASIDYNNIFDDYAEKRLSDKKDELLGLSSKKQTSNSSSSSYEERLNARLSEIKRLIEENNNTISSFDIYIADGKKKFELIDYTYVLYTDEFEKFKDEYYRKDAVIYLNEHGYPDYTTFPHLHDLHYMTDEARMTYLFLMLYEKNSAKAEEFYKKIEDDINKTKGTELAAEWIKNFSLFEKDGDDNKFEAAIRWMGGTTQVSAKGVLDGVNSFFSGLEDLNPDNWSKKATAEDYAKMYIAQYLIQETNYGKQYQFSTSLGNMLPAMTASFLATAIASPFVGAEVLEVLGPIVGSTLIGLSSAGSSIKEAIQKGNGPALSIIYGLINGLSEAGLEYVIGKVPGIGKTSIAKSKGLKAFFLDTLSNAIEEGIQPIISAVSGKILLGETINFEELGDEACQSFMMGAAMAVFMGGAGKTFKFVIDGVSYNIEVNKVVNYLLENPDTKLTKAELKSIIKSNLKDVNTNTAYTKQEISKLTVDYYELIKELNKDSSGYFDYKNRKAKGENVTYNQKYEDIIGIETVLKNSGIDTEELFNLIFESLVDDSSSILKDILNYASNTGEDGYFIFDFEWIYNLQEKYYSKLYDKKPEAIKKKLSNFGFTDQECENIMKKVPKEQIVGLIVDYPSSTDATTIFADLIADIEDTNQSNPIINTVLETIGYSDSEILILNKNGHYDLMFDALDSGEYIDLSKTIYNEYLQQDYSILANKIESLGFNVDEVASIFSNVSKEEIATLLMNLEFGNYNDYTKNDYIKELIKNDIDASLKQKGYSLNEIKMIRDGKASLNIIDSLYKPKDNNLHGEIKISGTNVYLNYAGSYYGTPELEKVYNLLNKIPDNLKKILFKEVREIDFYATQGEIFKNEKGEVVGKGSANSQLDSRSKRFGIINIFSNFLGTLVDTDRGFGIYNAGFKTILHELSHIVDKDVKLSYSEEYYNVIQNDKKINNNGKTYDGYVSSYASNTASGKIHKDYPSNWKYCEDFADSMAFYLYDIINGRSNFRTKYPNRAAYFDKIFN